MGEPVEIGYADAEAIEGALHPSQVDQCFGHEVSKQTLATALENDRLGQAWILSGPRGVGKATFAFSFAKYLLGQTKRSLTLDLYSEIWDVRDPNEQGAKLVKAASHPDLSYVTRSYDQKTKKFKRDISVDDIRNVQRLMRTTAGLGGWRICIIDSGDAMNRNAANALLKVLEEPPQNALFLIVSHQANRLLPTIRSRCRTLPFRSLDAETQKLILRDQDRDHQLSDDVLSAATTFSKGSAREAFAMLDDDLRAHQEQLKALLASLPNPNQKTLLSFIEQVTGRGADILYQKTVDGLLEWMHLTSRQMATASQSMETVAGIAELWEKAIEKHRETEIFNLDRKQMLFSLFDDLCSVLPKTNPR